MNRNFKHLGRVLLMVILAFAFVLPVLSQQKMSENAKKKEKVERSYKKAYAKARKKTIKHRRAIQTDATKERMDAADKRAEKNNKKNDPGFLERYFKKKRPRKK